MVPLVFFSFLIFQLIQCENYSNQIFEYRKRCMEELKLNMDDPKNSRNFNFLTNAQIHDIQCVERCILIKRGIINENETLQQNKLKENYPNINTTIDILETCPVIRNLTDKCEKGYLMGKCIRFHIYREFNMRHPNRAHFNNRPPPEWREYRTECLQEVHETESNLANSTNPNADNNPRFRREFCVQRCVMIKMGIINSNNTVQEDKVKRLFGNNQNLNITQCTTIKDEDRCKEAVDINRCLNRSPFLHV